MPEEKIKTEELNETVEQDISKDVTGEEGEGILADVSVEKPALPVKRQLVVVGALLLGVFSLGATPFVLDKLNSRVDPNANIANSSGVTPSNASIEEEPFLNISIGARAAFVFDVREGRVMFEREADLSWPLASITKLMTALVAREIIDEGAVIPMTHEAISQAGESGLQPGESFPYRRLSDLILLTSSNDGAYALAAAAGAVLEPNDGATSFVKAMNIRAKELGLSQTYFRNPTGLDISPTEAGAYGTAREVAKLMEYLIKNNPDILEETTLPASVFYSQAGERLEVENTNRIVESIGTVLASKTGYTTLA
ncbi:MAG: serine hydrolase, partial [Candidatus Paceibacterota bacterium]